ncbi:hypothetical protein F4803DRAFT_567666 [Xylaria telfairii]|nr:hypothetical protein F4803DRAFT_567666 [Xylaria telfairii]
MDPITCLGTITQLIDFAAQVSIIVGSILNAPHDLQIVKNDIATHLQLLTKIKCLLESDETLAIHFTDEPLNLAMKAMEELIDLVGGDFTVRNPDSLVLSLRRIHLSDIKWPLKETKLRRIREELERQKNSICLSLNCALISIVAQNQRQSIGIAQATFDAIINLNKETNNVERQSILNYCFPRNEDIQTLHKERMALQEPQTCDWISKEKSFVGWLKRSVRFIWIYGIPGSGKTVLASSIIERAARNCASYGYGYYYCLYSREQDETVPFLKFILRLLCKQNRNMVLPRLQEAYSREEGLSVEDLLDCLEELSHEYENGVYIIIDAVDESKPRENLLRVLCQIGTDKRFRKVSLLFTSREENDIMEHITQLGNSVAHISMSNPHVRDDIKRYIHQQLTTDRFFCRHYQPELISYVESHLTQKAKGMFRWAVCQLDVLKRTKGAESVRNALETLPKDIFATYERILTEIPPTDQEFARTALALICSDTANVTTAEVLVKASLWSVPLNDIENYTVATLKETCGSLISLTELDRMPPTRFNRGSEQAALFHRCRLAHYTVKEYLFSPDVANGEAQFFALSDQIVRDIGLKVIFAGLSHIGLFNPRALHRSVRPAVLSRYEEYCLQMTEKALKNRRPDILRNEDIRKIVIKSLTPRSQHFVHLSNTHGINQIMKSYFPTWQTLANSDHVFHKHPVSGLLVNLATLDWRGLADKYLESPEFKDLSRQEKRRTWTETFTLNGKTETLLGYCLRESQMKFLRMLVRHGASFDHEPEALYTAMTVFGEDFDKASGALEFLLNHGAYPNPVPRAPSNEPHQEGGRSFAFSPLQFAISELMYDWVELLLDEGADVNQLATPDGIIPPGFHDDMREIGQQKALDICSFTEPSLAENKSGGVGNNLDQTRERIKELLIKHGAEEPNKEPEDTSMMDFGHQTHNESDVEVVDLTL